LIALNPASYNMIIKVRDRSSGILHCLIFDFMTKNRGARPAFNIHPKYGYVGPVPQGWWANETHGNRTPLWYRRGQAEEDVDDEEDEVFS